MLKHGILGLLNYGPMTGYELKTVFRDSLSYFWLAQTSQIYRELQSLKKLGWVEDELVPQSRRPDKKPFHITEAGKEELQRWLADEAVDIEDNCPLLMKTFFLGELPPESGKAFFAKLLESSTAFIERIGHAEEKAGSYMSLLSDPYKSLYWEMTMEYGVMYKQMLSDWAARCMEKLEEIAE